MDPQSPPKRMTRARAAAKTSDPATKATHIVTAAAKAKTARTTTTTSTTTTTTRTATKRKTRSDEDEDEDHDELESTRKMPAISEKPTRGRGRPKKVAFTDPEPKTEPEPAPATTVRTRGRPKKVAESVTEEPVKATRTSRVKKSAPGETEGAPEPVKKTTRGRLAISAATTSTTAKSLVKPAIKKTVKFEEPEKENIVPARAAATKKSTRAPAPAVAAGLRGKPVRKAASTTSRTARGTSSAAGVAPQSEKEEKPMPLSPKKVNQLAMNRADSDDELALDEKVPVVRLKKMPIKPAHGGPKSSLAKAPAAALLSENDENAVTVSRSETELLMLGTPAKRLPPSPWKGTMKSPARRVEGLFSASAIEVDGQTSQASTRMGLLQTPAKRQPLVLNFGADSLSGTQGGVSPLKMSFLSSPAKRPISPIKPLPRMIEEEEPTYKSPAPKPTLLASPLPRQASADLDEIDVSADEDEEIGVISDDVMPESPTRLSFPGRLSAVLPRHADPALTPQSFGLPEETGQDEVEDCPVEGIAEENEIDECLGEPMVLDNPPIEAQVDDSISTTPTSSPPKMVNPRFGLREKDLDPYSCATDSDSDDESPTRQCRSTSAFSALPATPCPASTRTPTRMQSGRSTAKRMRLDGGVGFTPLAQQLSGWTAGPSPFNTGIGAASPSSVLVRSDTQERLALPRTEAASTPAETAQNTFFEDEMHVRPQDIEVHEESVEEPQETISPVLEDLPFTDEDMELAAEANEMSLMETEQTTASSQGHDDSLSEASQEYGDENAIPIDPALVSGNGAYATAVPPVTPQPVLRREFHTVAKVPLKPADESTPRPQTERRTRSSSRLAASRPTHSLTRNSTYPPTEGSDANPFEESHGERAESAAPVTPQKSDIWSTIGTPARTPRRDLNPGLLRGAVVFADVHTSDGADASGIFVELLTQMGARCVKNWSWNPSNSQSESGTDSKVGITHVVYKDGGKRTLEKVRESGGVVQCVGVSWVLE